MKHGAKGHGSPALSCRQRGVLHCICVSRRLDGDVSHRNAGVWLYAAREYLLVLFALSDSEAIDILRNATRSPDGLLVVDIPACRLVEASAPRVILAFDDAARTVSHGRQRAKLERLP